MPRLKLNLPRPQTPWTKIPNVLIQTLLPTLSDTELRIVLVLLRATVGWNKPDATVTLSYRKLMERTGRSSETVWKAVQSLEDKGIIHSDRNRPIQKPRNRVSKTGRQQETDSS